MKFKRLFNKCWIIFLLYLSSWAIVACTPTSSKVDTTPQLANSATSTQLPDNASTYTNLTSGLFFYYPETWTLHEGETDTILIYFNINRLDVRPEMFIDVYPINTDIVDNISETADLLPYFSSTHEKNETPSKTDLRAVAGGQQVAFADFNYETTIRIEAEETVDIFQVKAGFVENGKVFIVSGSARAEDESAVRSAVEMVMDSITIREVNEVTSPGDKLNWPRSNHTATLLDDGRVLIIGGRDNDGKLATIEAYDPMDDIWQLLPLMTTPRSGHTATKLADGRVLVVGGGISGESLGSTELFDPATNTWVPATDLNVPRLLHTATLLNDGRVLVSGGHDGDSMVLASTELYDPLTDTWTMAGEMNQSRYNHVETLLMDGNVLVIGGQVDIHQRLNSTEMYDSVLDLWIEKESTTTARTGHTATMMEDGTVVVVGNNELENTVCERYDPETGSWTTIAELNIGRLNHTATLLPNGTLLVIGGYGFNGTDFTALFNPEIYDPTSNTWQLLNDQGPPRSEHTAMLLTNDSFLLVGGQISDENEYLDSVQKYTPTMGP